MIHAARIAAALHEVDGYIAEDLFVFVIYDHDEYVLVVLIVCILE